MDPAPAPQAPKPWWQTSYLWILILVNVGAIATAAIDLFPPQWAGVIGAISTGCYAIARGLVGMGKAMSTGTALAHEEIVTTAQATAAQTAEKVVDEKLKQS